MDYMMKRHQLNDGHQHQHQQYNSVWKIWIWIAWEMHISNEKDEGKLFNSLINDVYTYTAQAVPPPLSLCIKSLANPCHKLNKSQFTHLPLVIIYSHQLSCILYVLANFVQTILGKNSIDYRMKCVQEEESKAWSRVRQCEWTERVCVCVFSQTLIERWIK